MLSAWNRERARTSPELSPLTPVRSNTKFPSGGFDAALGEDGAAGDSAADNSARGNVLTLSPWVDHASCENSQMSFPSVGSGGLQSICM